MAERFAASVARPSPTRLNDALACPQRHFLERVAGIERDEAPLGGPRFGARDLGSLVHRAFHRAVAAPGESADEIAARLTDATPLAGLERVHAEREIARAVRLLRAREAELAGPLAPALAWLERRLGGEDGVVLGEGAGRFALTGRLDRVDVDPAGTRAVIVDYKLGKAQPDERAKETLEGRDLQLPLYARALARETGHEVVGLEWVSATRRARAALVRADAASLVAPRREGRAPHALDADAWDAWLESAERRASDVVARVRAGEHALAPVEPDACETCAMRGPCRPDRAFLRLAFAAGGDAEGGGAEEGLP
jgi:RecB family exonuclease